MAYIFVGIKDKTATDKLLKAGNILGAKCFKDKATGEIEFRLPSFFDWM